MMFGFTAEYNIKSLGLKIARLEMQVDAKNKKINVKAKSTKYGSLATKLDNRYVISYDEQVRPLQLFRSIHQHKLDNDVQTNYDHVRLTAETNHPAPKSRYVIKDASRDVLTFLAFCSITRPAPGSYPIDANGTLWFAHVKDGAKTTVNTVLGKTPAFQYQISFSKADPKPTPYVDMITFNLVNKDTSMELWISEKGVPLKAKASKKSWNMTWELTGLQE